MKRLPFFISSILLIFVFLITSCERVCDDILKKHNISIVDQNDNPITGINLDIINTRTGNLLCSQITSEERRNRCNDELGESQSFAPGSGIYSIVTSFNLAVFDREGNVKDGDVIEVHGSVNGTEFSAQYTVRTDKCNLDEVIGTATIVLELEGD